VCSSADASVQFCCSECGSFHLCGGCARDRWRQCMICDRLATAADFSADPDFSEWRTSSSASDKEDGGLTISVASNEIGKEANYAISEFNSHVNPDVDFQRVLFYLAVPGIWKDDVLREGFRTRLRNSVPVARTEEDAITAFRRSHRAPPSVIAITSLDDGAGIQYCITRCPRSARGFQIQSPGLPQHCLADTAHVAYVAVPRTLRDTILREGYQPSRRRCVPTSASREQAARAYCRNFRASPYEVLAVLLSPEIPRHSHKGGWKLRTPVLPSELLRQLL